MGFYFRKSKSYGPFRFNLTKSGLGLSVGVKGARLSIGPKGTYINIGRHGIYYKKKLDSSSKSKTNVNSNRSLKKSVQENHESLCYKVVESSTTLKYQASKLKKAENGELEKDILRDLNVSKMYFLIYILISFLLCWKVSWWFSLISLIVYLMFNNYFFTNLNYSLSPEFSDNWEDFCHSFLEMNNSDKIWFTISSSGYSYYYFLLREEVRIKVINPHRNTKLRVKCNNICLLITGKHHKFLFLPNCLIIKEGSNYSVYSYTDLSLEHISKKFLEEEVRPKDARICELKWKYTKKSGEPDLRYKNNPSTPIYLYDCLVVYDSDVSILEICSSRFDASINVVKHFKDYINSIKESEIQRVLSNDAYKNDFESIADSKSMSDKSVMKGFSYNKDNKVNIQENSANEKQSDNIEDIFDYLEEDDENEL